MVQFLGLYLILAWALNIWAFMSVWDARPGFARLFIWAVILLIPVAGFIAWYLFGPRPAKS